MGVTNKEESEIIWAAAALLGLLFLLLLWRVAVG
jgi:hypothetical protein